MNANSAFHSVSRLLLSSIFVSSGLDKLMHREKTAQYMASKKMPAIPLFLGAAAATEIACGLALIAGWRPRTAASVLSLFLVPTSLVFHDFWNSKDEAERQLQLIQFMKNVAIMGGLLQISAHATQDNAIQDTMPIGYIEIIPGEADDERAAG